MKTKIHVVEQGDDLASIVQRHAPGHSVQNVLDLEANRALAALRKTHLLFPGDKVTLPDEPRPGKSVQAVIGSVHRFVVTRNKRALNVQFRRASGEPMASTDYVLEVEGGQIQGTTDGEGWMREQAPHGVARLRVRVGDRVYPLRLASLDPVERLSGVQSRLRNLGYRPGPSDGKYGPNTARAVGRFQRDHDLEAMGVCDEATRKKLVEVHGS